MLFIYINIEKCLQYSCFACFYDKVYLRLKQSVVRSSADDLKYAIKGMVLTSM